MAKICPKDAYERLCEHALAQLVPPRCFQHNGRHEETGVGQPGTAAPGNQPFREGSVEQLLPVHRMPCALVIVVYPPAGTTYSPPPGRPGAPPKGENSSPGLLCGRSRGRWGAGPGLEPGRRPRPASFRRLCACVHLDKPLAQVLIEPLQRPAGHLCPAAEAVLGLPAEARLQGQAGGGLCH